MRLILFLDMGSAWTDKINNNLMHGYDLLKWNQLRSDLGIAISDKKEQYRINIAKRTDTGYKPIVITFRLAKPF